MTVHADLCLGCFLVPATPRACAECGYVGETDVYHSVLDAGTILLNRYRVGRILGRPGGFGVTYLAYDQRLHRRVAVKELMPRELVGRVGDGVTLRPHTEEDRGRFRNTLGAFLGEARTLAKFSHPNVVRVLDYFEANGTAYVAMEFYEGTTLSDHAAELARPFTEDEVMGLARPLLAALEEVHQAGVLHRDIKPSNIYLTRGGTPVLLDFGSARHTMELGARTLTSVLTPGYAPFEQYHGRGDQGPWTDVYGVAATLYFLLTGEPPLEAGLRLDGDGLLSPAIRNAGVSEGLSRAIMQGLAMRPRERPPSAAAFLALLEGRDGLAPAGTRFTAAAPAGDEATAVAPETSAGVPALREGPDVTRLAPAGAASAGAVPQSRRSPGLLTLMPPFLREYWLQLAAGAVLVTGAGIWVVAGPEDDLGPRKTLPFVETPADASVTASPVTLEDRGRGSLPGPNSPGAATSLEGEPTSGAADARGRNGVREEGSTERAAPSGDDRQPSGGAPEAPLPEMEDRGGGVPGALPVSGAPASGEATSVAVLLFGNVPGLRAAESTLLYATSSTPGLTALDATSLQALRGTEERTARTLGEDPTALIDAAKARGVAYAVVGDLTAEARPARAGFHSGSASLDVRVYRVRDGTVLGSQTFVVGSGGIPARLGTSPQAAQAEASRWVADQAAQAVADWILLDRR